MPVTEFLDETEGIKPLIELIDNIMGIPEEGLNDESVATISNMLLTTVPPSKREQAIDELLDNLTKGGYTRAQAFAVLQEAKDAFTGYLDELNPSENKRKILDSFFDVIYEIFDTALLRFHNFDIVLNMKLDEGATVPTYAHESDAAADLYALEDMTLKAHSIGNKVHTGIHIQLPERWMAMIVPRSSIGAKTGLRLSNSVGIIDEQYLGELGVLYDNISDSDYVIHAGDRIAQMLIFPSYHFKANVVEELVPTERGEGGFGSTGA